MNLFNFIVCDFITGEQVDLLHFDWPLGDAIFPPFDLTLIDELVGLAVSHIKGSLARDLIVVSLAIPLIDESGVDLFEFGFGVDDLFCQVEA